MLSFSSYFSPGYLALYLPAAVLLYALAGQRGRRAVLLLFSYVCFWAVSGKLIAYLLLSTLSMYHTGLWLAHDQARTKELLGRPPRRNAGPFVPERRPSSAGSWLWAFSSSWACWWC